MKNKDTGAVILAGGASRRMGKDKALLRLEGRTFLERIAESLSGLGEVLLSVGPSRRYECARLRTVEDRTGICGPGGCGPMGGLYSALSVCKSERLLAVSCDMPLLTRDFVEYLLSYVEDGYDAVVPVTRDGREQPLCAVYSKRTAGILEARLAKGDCSIMNALEEMKVKRVSLRHSAYADAEKILSNVNTPEEYAALCRDVQGPPIAAVCGVKN
ncbi:MAG: molybdenum cofactor guanylyltransferase, partial [Oscillospiraceae bacterium]|nr:molybdenum cofactor guanylyltransferase [Oscillospiraceae bacterium]